MLCPEAHHQRRLPATACCLSAGHPTPSPADGAWPRPGVQPAAPRACRALKPCTGAGAGGRWVGAAGWGGSGRNQLVRVLLAEGVVRCCRTPPLADPAGQVQSVASAAVPPIKSTPPPLRVCSAFLLCAACPWPAAATLGCLRAAHTPCSLTPAGHPCAYIVTAGLEAACCTCRRGVGRLPAYQPPGPAHPARLPFAIRVHTPPPVGPEPMWHDALEACHVVNSEGRGPYLSACRVAHVH